MTPPIFWLLTSRILREFRNEATSADIGQADVPGWQRTCGAR
jgi:hypothetical protein